MSPDKAPDVEALRQAMLDRKATVGVVGLGYVGLPLIAAFNAKGFPVIGFDVDQTKIDALAKGRSYIRHFSDATIAGLNASGRFSATSDLSRVSLADAILICVPTPLTRQREPDMSYIVATAEAIQPHLRPGQLIVLESTTYPGTTDQVMRPILERGGLKSGRDIFIAYSPEREDPGNLDHNTSTIPKVVGGDGPDALALAETLYGQAVVGTVAVSNAATAEAVKLTENIFRSVNIALVNELKLIYSRMGIDVWEVIEAAKTKPFGFMPFYPGPGLGGHCIPIDPFYLTWKAREYELPTRFIELAGEINTSMPNYVVSALVEALSERFRKSINGSRVLIIGAAYKKNVDDMRESPALRLMELLEQKGARVDYHDPYVPEIPMTREHAALAGRKSVDLAAEVVAGYDAVLICTDHDDIDYHGLTAASRLVVDSRNATRSVTTSREKIIKA